MRSVRAYLIALVVTCLLLATIGFGVLIWQAQENGRRELAADGRETAQMLSMAVDAEIGRASGVLSALAASDAVRARDWATVDRQARAAFADENAWVVVQGRDGQQWVNTRLPIGSPLPKAPPPKAMWDVLDKGLPHICNLTTGAIQKQIVCVDVPAGSSRPPSYALSVIFRPQFFRALVRRQNVAAGELASLVDRNGRIIWRNRNPERFVGKSATQPLLSRVLSAPSGSLESTSLEGVPMLTAFQRSPKTGWTVIVGVPIQALNGTLLGALMHGSLLAAILVLLGCILAAILAGRLTGGLERLRHLLDPGADLDRYRPTGLAEFDATASALKTAFEAGSAASAISRCWSASSITG